MKFIELADLISECQTGKLWKPSN